MEIKKPFKNLFLADGFLVCLSVLWGYYGVISVWINELDLNEFWY